MRIDWQTWLVILVLAIAASAHGQEARVAAPGDQEADLASLRDEIAALRQRVETLEKQSLPAVHRSLGRIADRLEALDDSDLPAVRRDLQAVNERLEQVADSDGQRYYPNILGNMQRSPKFRREVARATQGFVLVDNRTGANQTLYVNGAAWTIPPGEDWEIAVPVGQLTTQLYPYEASRAWDADRWRFVNGRHELHIVIGY